jgi:hypothetical protein
MWWVGKGTRLERRDLWALADAPLAGPAKRAGPGGLPGPALVEAFVRDRLGVAGIELGCLIEVEFGLPLGGSSPRGHRWPGTSRGTWRCVSA